MYVEEYCKEKVEFFDLENPLDLARLENPMLTLSRLNNQLIVVDEIQRRPELFPVLRVLVDEPKANRKFLILGSASRDLIRQSSESLAGRIGYTELMPFSLEEIPDCELLWLRGGFPLAYLASNSQDSYQWRQSYISTFLERDIPNLGFHIPPEQIRRFWLMLAHYHGQIFNASEIGKSLGISDQTARKYLDILVGTFMIRQLTPWFENLGKRQVKSPKIYFRDSGILHALLGIRDETQLNIHPKLGAFWEGFALEEIIRQAHATVEECYFWKVQGGAELDLLIIKDGKRIGFEVKYTDRPKITPSMKIAYEDLKLDHLYLIFPGKVSFPLAEHITAHGIELRLPY
jgi:predicted AAA+ superfamily ATPase